MYVCTYVVTYLLRNLNRSTRMVICFFILAGREREGENDLEWNAFNSYLIPLVPASVMHEHVPREHAHDCRRRHCCAGQR